MGHLYHGELLNNQMVDFPHWSPFLCHQVSAVAAAPRGAQDGSPLVPRAACWSWDERSRAWAVPRDWAQAAVPLRGQWSFGGLRKIGMDGTGRGKDGKGWEREDWWKGLDIMKEVNHFNERRCHNLFHAWSATFSATEWSSTTKILEFSWWNPIEISSFMGYLCLVTLVTCKKTSQHIPGDLWCRHGTHGTHGTHGRGCGSASLEARPLSRL